MKFEMVRYDLMCRKQQSIQLENIDDADDIALLSTTGNNLTENAMKTGLHINQKRTKVMCMNLKERPQFKIDEEDPEVVTDFAYLDSNISVENIIHKYIYQPRSTKQGITTVTHVTYGTLMSIA